jgi:hypothetical protein
MNAAGREGRFTNTPSYYPVLRCLGTKPNTIIRECDMEPAFDAAPGVGLGDPIQPLAPIASVPVWCVVSVWLWRLWTKLEVRDDSPTLHHITQSGSVLVLGLIPQLGGVPWNQHLMQSLALVWYDRPTQPNHWPLCASVRIVWHLSFIPALFGH